MSNPWDQQPGEPTPAYVRFLIYRNLGPGRTLVVASALGRKKKAGNGRKATQAPGSWQEESARWDWWNRVTLWDIDRLTKTGDKAVVAFYTSIQRVAERLAAKLDKLEPRTWRDALEALQVLGNYIPRESVERLAAAASTYHCSPERNEIAGQLPGVSQPPG